MRAISTAKSQLARFVTWFHHGPGGPRMETRPQIPWRKALPVAMLGMLLAGIALVDRVGFPHDIDLTTPFTVGAHWDLDEAVAVHGGSITVAGGTYGYDGQWYLGLAYDPLLRGDITSTFDRPQYRAQRPLLPMAGWLVAAGQPAAIPFGLLLVEILAVGLGCAACARIVTACGRSRWWGMTFALTPGVLVGVLFGTAEPFGLALAVLGLSLALGRHYVWAGVTFAGAGLTKETYLAFAAVVAVYIVIDAIARGTEWIRATSAVVVPGVAAFAAWWLYVAMVLPSGQRTPNQLFTIPLYGWWEVFGRVARGEYAPDYPVGWGGGAIIVGTFGLIVVALATALWHRQSLLSYGALLWGAYALVLVGILLGRFLSAQRALAPAVLAAALLLITVPWFRRNGSRAPAAAAPGLAVAPGSSGVVSGPAAAARSPAGEESAGLNRRGGWWQAGRSGRPGR